MEFILDSPVIAAQVHKLIRACFLGGETCDFVVGFGANFDASDADLRVDPENQLNAGERDCLADVFNLFAFDDPELSGVNFAPFFSLDSTSGGFVSASGKLV